MAAVCSQQKYLQVLSVAVTPVAIDEALAEVSQPGTPDAWYWASYLPILETYTETRGMADETSWIKRKCAVYSWLGKIPVCGLSSSASLRLAEVESSLTGAILGAPGTRLLRGRVYHGDAEVSIAELLSLANRVLNSGETDNVASCSKLLHFMLPHLFPILDRRLHSALQGGISSAQPSGKAYANYLAALGTFLEQNGNRERLESASGGRFSALRVTDLVLFRRGKAIVGAHPGNQVRTASGEVQVGVEVGRFHDSSLPLV